jgi:hypothetical protein
MRMDETAPDYLSYLDLFQSSSRVGLARYGRDSVIKKIFKHSNILPLVLQTGADLFQNEGARCLIN